MHPLRLITATAANQSVTERKLNRKGKKQKNPNKQKTQQQKRRQYSMSENQLPEKK